MTTQNQLIPDELIINQIYYIRGQKVMLDRDLARLYEVETKVLKQSVKRHLARFPGDFMFEMSSEEFKNWRSQFVTSKSDQMGLRYAPYCFTEQGVAMLSSILNSERAIHVNIQIIRIFTRIRQILTHNTELHLEIEKIKNKLDNQDKNMEVVFRYLDELSDRVTKTQENRPRKRIGYKSDDL
ncbi:MAG: ORF6N domain-containing protein [Mucilaginibacter sp.]